MTGRGHTLNCTVLLPATISTTSVLKQLHRRCFVPPVRVHQLYGAGDDAHDPCGHQDDNEDNAVAFGDKSRSNKLVDSQERDCGDSDFDLIEEESVDNACVRIVHDPQADLGHTSAVPVDIFEDEGEFDVANGDVLLDDDEDATDVAGDIEEDLGVDADDGSFPFPIDRGVECKLRENSGPNNPLDSPAQPHQIFFNLSSPNNES
ncbi:hypothetical protein CSKR_202510 [Clonorchis sinensis]|uniref:Uncharacterized protein n=1 Tax=Clonorchis sinensis TaxID=79923 RepID=A0A8T1MWM0_CLOSI|nr:hypothetical protein CSKR_202510 [Clonorchis sinensis]